MSILWRDSLSKEPSGYLVGWVLRKENNGFCSTVSKGDWIIPCAVMSSSIKVSFVYSLSSPHHFFTQPRVH